jgi:hypothetical protein
MTKTAEEVLTESIVAYLTAERGGQVLTPLVVGLLTKHYVKSVMISDVDEVVLEEVLENANEAWEDEYGKALPRTRAREIESWILATKVGVKAMAKSGTHAVASSGALSSAGGDEDHDLFGDKGPTAKDRAQLREDEVAQRLSGAQIVQLSVAIELGSIPVLGDVLGAVRYGSDPRLSEQVRKAKKGGIPTLQTILTNAGPTVIRELNSHFANLIREYSEDGEVIQASNLNAWWSETQLVSSSPKMTVDYIKEYFRKFTGRGLPETVNVLTATRCANGMGLEGMVSKEDLKEVMTIAKAAKEAAAASKNEVNQLKSEINRLKNKGPGGGQEGGGGAGDAKMTCNFCGEKGHRWANCPKRAAQAKESEAPKEE